MCGIVGYHGDRDAVPIILAGLKRLEYRGYDSAGLAVIDGTTAALHVVKCTGKIQALESAVNASLPTLTHPHPLGIGHTRWATHGPPTQDNAHPHTDRHHQVAVVHNGIIENHDTLRRRLEAHGTIFRSQTDSEVLAHLIAEQDQPSLAAAVAAALRHVQGTYGIAVLDARSPQTLVAARKGSPIVVGICEGATIVASDLSAILQHTNQVILLDDGDILTVTPDGIDIVTLQNVPVKRVPTQIDWAPEQIEKGPYAHFMLKEIHEQPDAIANCLRGRLVEEDGTGKFGGLDVTPADLARINRIVITACGTSMYAGMAGGYAIEDLAGIPCQVEPAAEFRYRNPILQPDTWVIAVSQSGETADTLAAVREAQRKGCTVIGLCNGVGSTLARETHRGIYLHAGPEIGVASTKAFTCQVAVLATLALMLGRTRRLSAAQGMDAVHALRNLPQQIAAVLASESAIQTIAERLVETRNMFYIGRGYMMPAALEGALKIKEISYIHAEGYHAAELKHGPIALLDATIPVVACVPNIAGRTKTFNNIQECMARQSPVIAIASEDDHEIDALCDHVIRVPRCPDFLSPIPVAVAEQLLAYHVARLRGCPIDQPRNLAKSVTVE